MFGLNPYALAAKAAVLVIVALVAFGGGWKVKGWKDDAAQLAAVEEAVAKAKSDAEFSYQAAAAAAKHTEEVRVVTQTITHEVTRWRDRPVAHNVCLDADGLRLANAALRGEAPAGPQPDGAVPKAGGGPGDGAGGGTPR